MCLISHCLLCLLLGYLSRSRFNAAMVLADSLLLSVDNEIC